MKNRAMSGFFVLFLIVVSGTFFGALACRLGSPFRDTVLIQNFMISTEWKEIDVGNKIKIAGDDQFLSVTFDKPLEDVSGKGGIRSENGTIFNPEILLIDSDGDRYALIRRGKLGDQRSNYKYVGDLPKDKSYTKIIIRSDVPFEAKKIIWTYYYARDLH